MRSQGTRFPCACCHCPKPPPPCVCSREKRVSSPEQPPQEAWFIPTPPKSTPHWKKDFLRLRRQWSIRSKVPARSPPDDGQDFLPQTETKDHAGPCQPCPGDVRNMPSDEGKDPPVYGGSPPKILNLQQGEAISVMPTPRQTPVIPKSDMLSKYSSNTNASQKVADAPEDISITFHNIDADRDVLKSTGRAWKGSQPAHLGQDLTAPEPKIAPAHNVVECCHPIPQDPRIKQELNPTTHCSHNIGLIEQDIPAPHGSPGACHIDQGSELTRPTCSLARHSNKDLTSSRLTIPSIHQSGFVLSPAPIIPQTMYVTDPDRSPSTNRRQRAHPTTKHEGHNTSTGDVIKVDIGTSAPPTPQTNSVTVNLQADVVVSIREDASLYSGNDMKTETIVTVDVSKELPQRSYSVDRLVEITTTSYYTGPVYASDDPSPTTGLTEERRCRSCLQRLSTRGTETPAGGYCPERGMCWTCQCVPLSFDMNTQTDEVKLRSGDQVRSICDNNVVRPQREESKGTDRVLRRRLVDISGQKLKTINKPSKISSRSSELLDQICGYPLRRESIPSIVEISDSEYRSPRRTSSPSTIELSKEGHTTPPRIRTSPSANKPSNNGYKTSSRRASSPPVFEPTKEGYKTPLRRTISKNINKPFKEGYKTPPRRASSPLIIEACKEGFNIVPKRTSSPPTNELSKEGCTNPTRKANSPSVIESPTRRMSSPPTIELSKEGCTTPPRRESNPSAAKSFEEGYTTPPGRESISVTKPFEEGYTTPPRIESISVTKPFEEGYTTPPRRAGSPPAIKLAKQGYKTPSRRESSPPVIDLSKEGINITSISPLAPEISNTSYRTPPRTKGSFPNVESPLEIFTTASSILTIQHSNESLKKALIKNDIYEPGFLKRPHPHTGLRHHSFDVAAIRKNSFSKDNRDFRRGIRSLDTVPKVRLSINVEEADIPVGIMESIVDSLTLTSPGVEVEEVCTRTTVPLIEDIRVTKVEDGVKTEVKSIRERAKKLKSTLGDTTRKLVKK